MNGVFIKYGEKEHLQQIVDGSLRFCPSQIYVRMEEELHDKGQGDMLRHVGVRYCEIFVNELIRIDEMK